LLSDGLRPAGVRAADARYAADLPVPVRRHECGRRRHSRGHPAVRGPATDTSGHAVPVVRRLAAAPCSAGRFVYFATTVRPAWTVVEFCAHEWCGASCLVSKIRIQADLRSLAPNRDADLELQAHIGYCT